MNNKVGRSLAGVGVLSLGILALGNRAGTAQENVIYVDLEQPGATVVVPAGGAFKVHARLVAPGQKYRYLGIYNTWFNAETPTWHVTPMGAGCDARQQSLMSLLASRTLQETRQAVEAFRSAPKEARCPAAESAFERRITELSPELHVVIGPGYEPQELTMQRLSEAGQPVETWRWRIVVGTASAPPSSALRASAPPVPALPISGEPVFEEGWIVRSVVEEIAALVTQGSSGPPMIGRGPAPGRYRIDSPDPRFTGLVIDAAPFVWDPAAFVRVARAILGAPAGQATARPSWTSPISVLATPTAARIYSLERELRSHLAEFPRDAHAHEASALLLGVLGMRHSEGALADVRPVLNRMTAHLALASALGTRPNIEAELARVILDLLTGRERPAATALTRLKAAMETPGLASWHRGLWMRATKDWRVLTVPGKASLLERLEYIRALSRTRGVDAAASELPAVAPEEIPDWTRILLTGDVSVEVGNALAGSTLQMELAEALTVGGLVTPQSKTSWWWKGAPSTKHHPIPDELWRALIERTIANAILARERHLHSLADRSRIYRFREETLATFAQSDVVSMLAPLWAADIDADKPGPGIADGCLTANVLAHKAPWNLSVTQWNVADTECPGAFPKPEGWFAPWLPRGTLFDLKVRLAIPALAGAAMGANWTELLTLPTYDFDVLGWAVGRGENRDPEKKDFEKFRSEFGYNTKLLLDWRRVATTLGQPQEALEPARLACQLEPQECFMLIDILRANGLSNEAFQAAEQAFKEAGDSVRASHEADWVVDEYVRLGRLSPARELAAKVAQTGSEPGLLTVARLLEREGRYEEAQRLLQRLDERYRSTNEKKFLVRRLARTSRGKKSEIEAALVRIVAPVPEGGMSEINALVTEDWLSWRGLLFRAELEAMGAKVGDVIEDVNGTAVKSLAQVVLALTFDDRPQVTLTLSRQSSSGGPAARLVVSGELDRPSYEPIR